MNPPVIQTHQGIVKNTLPSWYVYTTAELRQRLHRDMLRSHHLRDQMQKALGGMQDLTAFARPILSRALTQAFGPGLDIDRDHFRHVRFAQSILPLPGQLVERTSTVQSLLEAALQNFHQEEVEEVTADSVIFQGKPNLATFAAGTSFPHPLKIPPAKFMTLCRTLDLGGQYQAHLKRVLEPAASELPAGALNAAQIKELLSHQVRNALYVEAHLAHMKGDDVLSNGAYRSVLAASGHWAEKGRVEAVHIQSLTLLGFAVRDILVFQTRDLSGCVVYLPGDPSSPLKEYDSLDHFMKELRAKLRSVGYQQYFAGFIAQRRRAEFLGKLRACLTPHRLRPVPGDTGLIARKWKVPEVDENADLRVCAETLPYPLLEHLHFQRMLRIKDDARSLAVPTGDEDEASRRARLAHYLALGMNVVNMAALFVPMLGEVMMVVAGAQLLVDTFEGVEAWVVGDMEQALEHLASVAQNLAMLAAFAAAGKVASPGELPAITESSFVGKMIPVKLENGQTRLWSPDLTPFASDVILPQGMKPGAEGIFEHQGVKYVGLQGRFYRVELDTALNKWRIKAPRANRYSPPLEHNGAGAWRHEGENPLTWDVKTSFRRLGYSVEALSDQAVEDVLAVTGTDQTLLATLHLESLPPPSALTDAVERFGLDEQVTRMKDADPESQFDRLNQLREISDDPLVQLIKRDFPGMTCAGARELLSEAGTEQLASMKATQSIPLNIAGRARGYLQQTRIDQALEGFFLKSPAASPDTLKLSLRGLEQLPGWPRNLRIEIRDEEFGGTLLDGIGERSTPERRILIKKGDLYTPCEASGNKLAPQDTFFASILHALPKAAIRDIGLTNPAALRSRIVSQATRQRNRVAKILGLQEITPGFRGPVRLADRRFGYVLSGRGAALPDLPAESVELIAALSVLYPEVPSMAVHVQNLLYRGWSIPQLVEMTQARLQSWEMLRSALEGWVNPVGPGRAISNEQFAVRQAIAEALARAWRFSDRLSPMHSSNMLLENIDLTGFSDMPELPAHYAEIHYLTLSGVTGGMEDVNRFLGRFAHVTRLEILGRGLSAVPESVASMGSLVHLSLEGMGLTIDQQAMELFMRIQTLDELDLSGNVLGEITDVSRLRVATLWLNQTGLTQWPSWVEDLPLQSLDISDNQITHLPDHIIENSVGQPSQLTIHAYENPINFEDLRRFWINDRGYDMTYRLEFDFPEEIRELVVNTTSSDEETSSDDDVGWHAHNAGHVPLAPPVPSMEIWLVEGRTELNSRLSSAWQTVAGAGDAPNLLVLLQRLREAPDFQRFHEELANDVMRVLEAAAENPILRAELETMADDRLFGADQTCEDGARLIFSDIQVAVYAQSELQGVPEAQHTEVLFRVLRGLFRLNEVQTIADLEIASREARGIHVDHAEVRIAYRIGLAQDLNLPGQPLSMAWSRLASVDRQAILSARRLVLERELSDEFVNYALADRRWNERLRAEHQTDLERVTASIKAQMDALEEHPPVDATEELRRRSEINIRLMAAQMTTDLETFGQATLELEELTANPPIDNDEYDRQGRALIASLSAAEKALLEQLTNNMRQQWF
ncbi:dermonecrotic toxin domain-containing protein [Pseudomonas caspiana]|uniref:dermonecrotic toxin domain-containing protein n=1 Tax=Pseudomonas caspiana TaxID=1451454 RepID=UPI0032EE895F